MRKLLNAVAAMLAMMSSTAYASDYDGYLFAYFEGSGEGALQEHLRFALSNDGFNWKGSQPQQPCHQL